ncbi:hypothetical protein EG329_012332 [Mollisiaceae sp. DMI_Dod_QoI]|nr:hypothetical protein EG329_012332 [Helotiales sp. DMI_Dod_QoI]
MKSSKDLKADMKIMDTVPLEEIYDSQYQDRDEEEVPLTSSASPDTATQPNANPQVPPRPHKKPVPTPSPPPTTNMESVTSSEKKEVRDTESSDTEGV